MLGRWSRLAISALVVIAVSACGDDGGSDNPGDQSPTAAADATETAATTATASPAETETATSSAGIFPLEITDAAGQVHHFEERPVIGCHWAGCAEMFADFGDKPSAVNAGLSQGTFWMPNGVPDHLITDGSNAEEWAGAGIDLIVKRVPASADDDALKQAADIFYLHHPSYGESSQSGYQAYIENIRLGAQLLGDIEAGEAAIGRFEAALDSLRALATDETRTQTVAVLFQGEGYRAIGPGNPFCDVLVEVGLGTCVGEGAASAEINAEEFLSLNPTWIVYQSGDGSFADRSDPVWPELSAVQNDQVYDATGNRYYCCSTRGLIHALQEFAAFTLPDAGIPKPATLEDFDPTQSVLVIGR